MDTEQKYLLNTLNESIESRPLNTYGAYQRELLHTLCAYVLKKDLQQKKEDEDEKDEDEICKCSPSMHKFFEGLLNLKEMMRFVIDKESDCLDICCKSFHLNWIRSFYTQLDSLIKEKQKTQEKQ